MTTFVRALFTAHTRAICHKMKAQRKEVERQKTRLFFQQDLHCLALGEVGN